MKNGSETALVENPTRRRSFQIAALFAFSLSGFAALLYQIVWQRMLVFFSGADVYASTVIVAAFMAGLGIGNLAGGVVADRVSRRAALAGFAVAELAIALFSLVSRSLYYDLLYQGLAARQLDREWLGAALFISLLWPTFFMGVSLPLLAKAVTSSLGAASARVGRLYAVNTLGAAAGAFATTWVILPAVGLDQALRIGAAMNGLCMAVVLPFLAGRPGAWAQDAGGTAHEVAPSLDARLPFAAWVVIYAISGFVALSLEIVWFRLLGVMAKATAFTFGTLLTIYLAGIAGGAWLGSIYAPRLRRPTLTVLLLLSAIGLLGGMLVATLVIGSDRLVWLQEYFGRYEPLAVPAELDKLRFGQMPVEFVMLYFGLPAALLLPPTFLMGFCFPILQRIVQTDFARLGRRLGALMLANIAGSVLGTVVTGVIALDILGTAGTLKALALVSIVFAFATLGSITRGRIRVAILASAAVVFALVWRAAARCHGSLGAPAWRGGRPNHRRRGCDGSFGGSAGAQRASGAIDDLREWRRSEHHPLRRHPYCAWHVSRVSSSGAARRRHHRAGFGRHGIRGSRQTRNREYHLRGNHRSTVERIARTGESPTLRRPRGAAGRPADRARHR